MHKFAKDETVDRKTMACCAKGRLTDERTYGPTWERHREREMCRARATSPIFSTKLRCPLRIRTSGSRRSGLLLRRGRRMHQTRAETRLERSRGNWNSPRARYRMGREKDKISFSAKKKNLYKFYGKKERMENQSKRSLGENPGIMQN